MPELPEVETVRRYLERTITGKTISDIEILYQNSFKGTIEKVKGLTVTELLRRGKVLNIQLSDKTFLSIHLKMSGQVLVHEDRNNAEFIIKIPLAENGKMPARTTRVIIDFTDGSALFFNDLRKFGWVRHGNQPEGTTAPDVTKPEFTLKYFTEVVQKSGRPIKTLLLDQDKIAGVGNIYANDALFIAKVLPSRISKTLTLDEIKKLHTAVISIIEEGVTYNGTSATDVYVIPDGKKGSYQDHFKVYAQEGKPCKKCGTLIRREKVGGRSNFFCPVCQQ